MIANLSNFVDKGCFWLIEDVKGFVDFETLFICDDEGAWSAQQSK